MDEIWRDIPDWRDYQISDLGRVKRLAGSSLDGRRRLKERLLNLAYSTRNNGNYMYVSVGLGNSFYARSFSVARLVLLAFVGPPQAGQECRHLDDNSTNCRLTNLAWGTRLENKADAIRNGRTNRGSTNPAAKLTEEVAADIRRLYVPYSHRFGANALARYYGVGAGAVYDIVHGRTWDHV